MERNIAVVGCGYWGRNLVRDFTRLGALHTICDANAEVLEQYVSSYPGINREREYSHILKNNEIRGVVIATPAVLHYSMAKEALKLGGLETLRGKKSIRELDYKLRKSDNLWNPGTTADITTAALALSILRGYRP